MFRVVFLDDTGPRRTLYYEDNFNDIDAPEFLSMPYRALTGYARTRARLKQECEFVRVPLVVARPQPAGIGLGRHLNAAFALDAAEQAVALRPDLIALSLYAWNVTHALLTADLIRQLDARVPIVAGGPEVLGEAETLLSRHPAISVLVEGDGEEAFLRLLEYYALGCGTLADVPSAVFRDGRRTCRADIAAFIPDLDAIPSLVQPYGLREITRGRICYYEASRGCPNRCTYCQFSKGNRKVRSHSLERVIADLEHLRNVGVRRITFVEPMFTLNVPRARKILEYLNDQYVEAQVFVEMNLDHVPAPLVAPLRGLLDSQRMFCGIGVQSSNRDTLAQVGRRCNLDKLKENAKALFPGGMKAEYQIMAGLPGDRFEDILATLDFGWDMLPGLYPSIFPVMVLPGTALRNSAGHLGLVYDPAAPYYVLKTASLSAEGMRKAWILYRVVPRLVGPMAAFAKDLGLALPNLYRELFTEDCFAYTRAYGYCEPAADLRFIGQALRKYLLARAPEAGRRELIGENIDLLTVLSPEYDGRLAESLYDLPSRVRLPELETRTGAGPLFYFRHFGQLEAANRIYLEKSGGEYAIEGENLEEAYCLLSATRKVVFGTGSDTAASIVRSWGKMSGATR